MRLRNLWTKVKTFRHPVHNEDSTDRADIFTEDQMETEYDVDYAQTVLNIVRLPDPPNWPSNRARNDRQNHLQTILKLFSARFIPNAMLTTYKQFWTLWFPDPHSISDCIRIGHRISTESTIRAIYRQRVQPKPTLCALTASMSQNKVGNTNYSYNITSCMAHGNVPLLCA